MKRRIRNWHRSMPGTMSPAAASVMLVTCLIVAMPALSAAQTFDQAVQSALNDFFNDSCNTIVPGSGLSDAAGCTNAPGVASAGLQTVHTRLGAAEDVRQILRRLQEKRDEERRGGAPGASPDLPRGLGVFASGEYERFDKDLTRFEPAYDSDTWSLTVGADYTFTRWLVAGLAFSYSRVDGEFDLGGDFSTDSYGPLAYASIRAIPNAFVDLVTGYSHKDFSVDRLVASPSFAAPLISGTARGDTDGEEFKTGVLAGYDFIFGNVTVGPRVGVNYKSTTIDAFEESGSTGLELAYRSQNQESLTTRVGLYGSMAISTPIGVFIPQATVDYLHEFLDDQRSIHFHFVDDTSQRPYLFKTDPPDRDYFHVGAGLVVALPGGFYPFVNYRALVGYEDESSHVVTAGLRVAF